MTPNDLARFSALWIAAYEIYGKACSDALCALAFNVLARFELSDVDRAIQSHLLDPDAGRFPPKPADIAKYILGDPESKPLEAWTKVETAISRVGPYKSVVFDDQGVMAVIEDMGGWILLCSITNEELPFKRNEFCTRYRGFMTTPRTFPRRLCGREEMHNGAVPGFQIEPPIFIGDTEKAKQIYLTGSTAPKLEYKSAGDIFKSLGHNIET